jgi:hypothetical protein
MKYRISIDADFGKQPLGLAAAAAFTGVMLRMRAGSLAAAGALRKEQVLGSLTAVSSFLQPRTLSFVAFYVAADDSGRQHGTSDDHRCEIRPSVLQLYVIFPAFPGNEDMGELRIFAGSMPVFLTFGENNDISRGDRALLILGCDDSFSRRDDQDLITLMHVELVSDPPAEIDDAHVKIAVLRCQGLNGHILPGKKRTGMGFFGNFINGDDMHWLPPEFFCLSSVQ